MIRPCLRLFLNIRRTPSTCTKLASTTVPHLQQRDEHRKRG